LNTEWFDLDEPCDDAEMESVKDVFRYLSKLGPTHIHRSCKMNHIFYPVEFRTLEGKTVISTLRLGSMAGPVIQADIGRSKIIDLRS
jgi:hypothetical protein